MNNLKEREGMACNFCISGKGQEQVLCYVTQQDCMLNVNSSAAASARDCCIGDGMSFRTDANNTCQACVGEHNTLSCLNNTT